MPKDPWLHSGDTRNAERGEGAYFSTERSLVGRRFTRPEQEEKEDEKQQQEDSKRSEALAHIKSVRGKPRGVGSKAPRVVLRMFLSNH